MARIGIPASLTITAMLGCLAVGMFGLILATRRAERTAFISG
ncbi:hypothetical protein FBZ99_12412 [Rhizobium sp. ERR 1071]|nr:hypothetical protein FBZ99_12412 [Rhizobium sp. ERR1071]